MRRIAMMLVVTLMALQPAQVGAQQESASCTLGPVPESRGNDVITCTYPDGSRFTVLSPDASHTAVLFQDADGGLHVFNDPSGWTSGSPQTVPTRVVTAPAAPANCGTWTMFEDQYGGLYQSNSTTGALRVIRQPAPRVERVGNRYTQLTPPEVSNRPGN